MEEAGAVLGEYVARHQLAGSQARLCLPARNVYTARVAFPDMRDGDLREALELELERLFPFPAKRLRFAWRKTLHGRGDGKVTLVVAATPSDYLDRWEECVSRVGLVLSGAIPAGWALSSACARIGFATEVPEGLFALLRNAGNVAEVTVLRGAEPVFSASRACLAEEMPAQATALAEEGVPDMIVAPVERNAPLAEILAPSAWHGEIASRIRGNGISWKVNERFEENARKILSARGEPRDPWEVLGAFGAAAGERTMDLLSPVTEEGFPWFRAAAWFFGAAAALFAFAWPATVAWKAGEEMRRLDARIAFLQTSVDNVRHSLDILQDVNARIDLLREAGTDRMESIEILRSLTECLPSETWLTGLRVDGRKVEIDGFSPAASEIFPFLTRDGRFRSVEFAAPIIRQGDNLERFQIRAEYIHCHPAKAGPGGGE